MKTYLDCIPCFFKQALEAGRLAKASPKVQKRILDKLAMAIPKHRLKKSPPYMGRLAYKIAKKQTRCPDPYLAVKKKSNKLALKLYRHLKKKVMTSPDPLLMAVELACRGNIIDLGVKNCLDVEKEVDDFLNGNFNIHKPHAKATFRYKEFKNALRAAKTILYIADNAGEIVFDKVLIEEIINKWQDKDLVFAVRGKPIINDALIEDAFFCGIDKIAKVISSGCDAPGAILEFCSKSFVKVLKAADLIISKGQGNFEALSSGHNHIFFLFRAKCPVVAKHLNCRPGDVILTPS
ncbi:MAG: DUF89 family protein [Candidatus Omnitrophica bacterium]|nr:DUF89 family protein [Candidatus Omnitrophota bacterium]